MPVVLHERCARLGGRLGELEVDGLPVGAGCSYIKATHPDFVRQLEDWAAAGVAAEWHASPHLISAPGVWAPMADEGERWFVGVPGMGSPLTLSATELASIRVVREAVFDTNFEESRDTWVVASEAAAEEGASLEAEVPLSSHLHSSLVVATGVAEAEEFLGRKTLDAALGRGRYKDFVKERVSAVFAFEEGLRLPFGFAAATYGSPITVAICDDSRREAAGGGGASSIDGEVWVVQSSTGWADGALEAGWGARRMEEELLRELGALLDRAQLPPLRAAASVVWPYGDKDYELEGGCVWREESRLAMAGDWAFDGRVEGAWLSGRAAAQKVLGVRFN